MRKCVSLVGCIVTILVCAPLSARSDDVEPKLRCKGKTPAELAEWQASSRQLLFKLLQITDLEREREKSPTKIPCNVKTVSTEKHDHYTLQEIELDSTPTRRIKAVLTIPEGAGGKLPAIVCIHGHAGNRHIVYDANSLYRGFADELASHGYVTISTEVGQHEVYEKDRTLMGERLWDVLRCADYLTTLKEVDANRMGCAGLSLGGEMAMWLGAMDPRMKVTVSSGFLTTAANLKNGHCQCWDFPGLTENFDFSDIYSLIAPRALMCQIGAKETAPGGFPPAFAHEAMAGIQHAYAMYALGNLAQLKVHPNGHVFEVASGCKFIEENLETSADDNESSADQDTSVRAAVESVLRTQEEAWNRGDIDAFMDHYWKSDELTFSSEGKTTRGWNATLERYRERYGTREKMGRLSFRGLEITPLGNPAALVLGQWKLERESEPVSGNFSLVLRKLDDRWVIVHDHTSRLVE